MHGTDSRPSFETPCYARLLRMSFKFVLLLSPPLDDAPHDGPDLLSGLQHLDAEGDDLVAVLEARGDECANLVEGRHRNGPALQHAGIVDAIDRRARAAVEDRGQGH